MVVKLNFIYEQILNGTIALKWIDTKGMVADMLTKALPLSSFSTHEKHLMEGFSNIPIEAKRSVKTKKLTENLDYDRKCNSDKTSRDSLNLANNIHEVDLQDTLFDEITYI